MHYGEEPLKGASNGRIDAYPKKVRLISHGVGTEL